MMNEEFGVVSCKWAVASGEERGRASGSSNE